MTMEAFARALQRAIITIRLVTAASSEWVAGVVPVTTMAIIARKVSSLFGTAFAQSDTNTIVTSFDRLAVPTQLDIPTCRCSL
jgi:carbohydrate-binding DOMON domain-containing protein